MVDVATSDTVTRESPSLHRMFAPRRVAIVGASDKSAWSRLLYTALKRSDLDEIVLINARSGVVHGSAAAPSLTAANTDIDLAYVITPADAALEIIDDAAHAGVANLVMLSSGFAETGAHGRGLEAEIRQAVTRNRQMLLGPNTLGFVNFTTNSLLWPAGNGFRNVTPGPVALITQSGALGGNLCGYAGAHGIGLSLLCATGNEAGLTLSDVVDHAVDDPSTTVIALFVEAVRNPAGLIRSARRALEAGKPIVALKVGRSALAAQSASSHTGAIVGDDAVTSVALNQAGVMRVYTLEDLMVTAGVLARTGSVSVRGVAVAAISGGVCDVAADTCDRLGLPLPAFSEVTQERLGNLLPDYASAQNPLDLTGAVVRHPTLLADVIQTLADDGGPDVILCQENLGKRSTPTASILNAATTMRESPVPAFLIAATGEGLTEDQQVNLRESNIPFLPGGLNTILGALARLRWWRKLRARFAFEDASQAPPLIDIPTDAHGTWSEYRTSQFLAEFDIPVIPSVAVGSRQEAVDEFLRSNESVAMKILSPDIAHKSDVGGVRLGLDNAAAVATAFDEVIESARAHRPDATVLGVTLTPMRSSAVELIVGVTTDSQWGKVLTVGAGGLWTEIMKDVSSRVLPVSADEVRTMLDELRSAPLLRGARGTAAVDLGRLSTVIARIGALAVACGDQLVELEVNPLRVEGDDIEAMDALAVWQH